MKPAGLIVIVLPDLRMGGGQRVLLQLSGRFLGKGHEVKIVTLIDDGELAAEIPPGVVHHCLRGPTRGGRMRLAYGALHSLSRYLRDTAPAGVISSMTGTNLLTSIAHWRAGSPGRLMLREAASLTNVRSRLARMSIRWLYRRAQAILAVSAGIAEELRRTGLDPNRIRAIPNPVDLLRIRSLADQVVPRLPQRPYIVAVGRLTAQKDHATLLRAFAAANARNSHALVLIGDGEERSALVTLARALDVEPQVTFLGLLDNPYPAIAAADLLALSSRWEGCPNVLLEALALGVPVVATDCPTGPNEILKRGRLGRLAGVGDYLALAVAIDAELLEPSERRPGDLDEYLPERVADAYLDALFPAHRAGPA